MLEKLKQWLARRRQGPITPRYDEYLWEVETVARGTVTVTAACADVVRDGVWFRDRNLLGVLYVPHAQLIMLRRVNDNTSTE